MKWQIKAAILFGLSRLPNGRALYRKLQDRTGSNKLDINDQYGMKVRFLKRVMASELPIAGKDFLEIGTGWYPVLPILLSLTGAKRVLTYDLNPWLTIASLKSTLRGFESIADRLAADFGLSAEYVTKRLRPLINLSDVGSMAPAKILEELQITYVVPGDASDTALPAASLDYVVSSNVFEHIPPVVLQAIIDESKRILRPGGASLHHVDPGDHYSLVSSITTVNFLKYSKRAWYFIGGSGLAYHNRLRCVDYSRMFEHSGFKILAQFVRTDDRALLALKNREVRVDRDFRDYTLEELAGVGIDIFAALPLRASERIMAQT